VPLHWNHSSDPEDIVGHVNPESVKAQGSEVVAAGEVDLHTDHGRHIAQLDVFEITVTAGPMNA
jgi:hypothetical protein